MLMKYLADGNAFELFACLRAVRSQAAGIHPAGIRSLRVADEMFARVFERSAAGSAAAAAFFPALPALFHVFLISVCIIHDKKMSDFVLRKSLLRQAERPGSAIPGIILFLPVTA